MSIYTFPTELNIEPSVRHSVSCIFCYRSSHLIEIFLETFEQIANVALPPSRIIVVCPDGLQGPVRRAFVTHHDQISERLRVTSHILLISYGCDGKIINNQELLHGVDSWEITDSDFLKLAVSGVRILVADTNVILQSPAGYQFRKPSGDKSPVFIRTGNMLREPHCLAVFVPLLLRRVSSDVRKIYIDSSTILPFAMELQRALSHFSTLSKSDTSKESESLIINFQSYSDVANLTIDRSQSHVILISASTSGNLAKKMLDRCNALSDRTLHLIGAGSASSDRSFRESCIYFQHMDLSTTERLNSRDIHIVGEEFIISPSDSTAVRISQQHVNTIVAKRLVDPFYRDHLKVFVRAGERGYSSYSPVIIRDTQVLGSDSLIRWLGDEVMYSIPLSVGLIVHVDSSSSRSYRLATDIQERIHRLRGRSGDATPVCSVGDLESPESLSSVDDKSTILVVASEDPGLQGFRRASRSIRSGRDLYIHYLICHAFPETLRSYERVKDDLRHRVNGQKYGWSEFTVLPIGSSELHDSWWIEHRQLMSAEKLSQAEDWGVLENLRKALKSREEWLSGSSSSDDVQFFLPTIKGDALLLQPDSVFFRSGYEVGDVSQEVVYVMVASALQYAREGTTGTGRELSSGLRFDDNPFVSSVIDPRMFSRFSDGVLQAAFLRALSCHELDYTRNAELSTQLCDIVCSVIDMIDTQVGEASLEFLAALHTNKISLIGSDMEVIHRQISGCEKARIVWEFFGRGFPI